MLAPSAATGRAVAPVTRGLKLLRAYRRLDIEALAGLRLPPSVEAEVEVALRRFIRTVLEREARSLAFLDEVRTRPAPVALMTRLADAKVLPAG